MLKSPEKDGKKFCASCGKWKPLSEFSPDKKRPDGTTMYKSSCRKCRNDESQRVRDALKEVCSDTPDIKVIEEVHHDTPINIFTADEMSAIIELINILPNIKRQLNTNIDEGLLQGHTVSKTFKVYQNVLDMLSKYMTTRPGEKILDVVSTAIVEYMSKH